MWVDGHIKIGALGALPVYFISGSPAITCSYLLSNSLIDIDHFPDYWYDHGFNMNWNRFYRACEKAKFVHYILFLHSYEFLGLLLFFAWFLKGTWLYPYLLGVFLGVTCHLICEIIYNKGIHPKYYFLINRWRVGFLIDKMRKSCNTCQKKKREQMKA